MNARVASFCERMKSKGYARRTIDSYVWYAQDFGRFLLARKVAISLAPGEKLSAYLAWLYECKKSRVTQNVAFNAVRLFYNLELGQQVDTVDAPRRAPVNYIPTVLRAEEVCRIVGAMTGVDRLMAAFLYGTGIRIDECVNLRVKDLDFAGRKVRIYSGKGGKARETLLPESLSEPLQKHLVLVRRTHEMDLRHGFGRAELPAGSGAPSTAESQWEWQYVFPASRVSGSLDAVGVRRRWYYHPDNLRKALRAACRKIGEQRRVTPHTFRHSFATQMLYSLTYPVDPSNRMSEYDARTYVKSLMGHVSEKTFEHYTRTVLEWASPRMVIVSPLDVAMGSSR